MTDDRVFLCAVHTEPGHRVVQAIFWTLWPSQKAPPLSGAGLVQVLVRFWKPLPQRLLHTDHSVQVDQPPFTAKREKKSLVTQTVQPGQPQRRVWLCVALSSDHKSWHEKQQWIGTNPCLQHTKCTPEVIVQAEEMLMLNEKHCLMTIRVGRWPALSWKKPDPALSTWWSVYDQNPCRFRELWQPEACALKVAPFSRGRSPAHSHSCLDAPIPYACWETPMLSLDIKNFLFLSFKKMTSGCQDNFTHASMDIAGAYINVPVLP